MYTLYHVETILWLHQRMVDPILTQGCEVWGPIGVGNQTKESRIYPNFRDGGKLGDSGRKNV